MSTDPPPRPPTSAAANADTADAADAAEPGVAAGGGHPLGRRIAELRQSRGLTQQELADRVAISRVALSNLESARSVPGERTVALLAGIFGCEPLGLVAGTDYPAAKAERLPLVVARHTEADLQLALLERDLRWIEGAPPAVAERVLGQWRRDLAALAAATFDDGERTRLVDACRRLAGGTLS
jgi:transcriptional regulator with XRE-family HTH domain